MIRAQVIGAAAYSAMFIASQLFTAFVFDAVGAFDFVHRTPSARRSVGVVLAVLASVTYQLAPRLQDGRLLRGSSMRWSFWRSSQVSASRESDVGAVALS